MEDQPCLLYMVFLHPHFNNPHEQLIVIKLFRTLVEECLEEEDLSKVLLYKNIF
jgi:hypothetical protein